MKKIPNEYLRQAREKHGWTQAQLAEKMAVGVSTVRSWESGTRFPSLVYRSRLCDVLQMTLEQLGLQDFHEPSSSPEASDAKTGQKGLHPGQLDKNRRNMLKRVRVTWIEGVLDHSLHHTALLALGLQEQPDALVNPWRLQIQQIDETPEPLPIGTRITQVYDKAAGELLILGEPGAGKTTLLLELARDLLDRAEQDEEQAIPVIFNLSSWATGQQSLSEWLVGELCIKYRTPLKVAEEWIATNQLIILLDGLDEVNEAVRSRCVQAINAYQKIDKKIDKFVSIVVCCRAKEYFGQETRVTLQEAVFIQPLTEGQVEDYLSSTGTQLEEARKAFREDAELHEMMKTPLMLSIVTLAYQGNSQQKTPLLDSGQTRRQQIFEIYTQHMLHREKKTSYEEKQTIQWLSWLAQQMAQHHQTEFFIERLQPDWLPDAHTRYHYQNMVNRFHFGLSIIIYAGVYACFRGDSVPLRPGLFSWVGGGKGNTLLEWMRPGLGAGLQGASRLRGWTSGSGQPGVDLTSCPGICRTSHQYRGNTDDFKKGYSTWIVEGSSYWS